MFGVITLYKYKEDIIIIIPNYKNKFGKIIFEKKINNKLKEILYNQNINYVVLSKSLQINSKIKNTIYEENLNILNGTYLFKIFVFDVLQYISAITKKDLSEFEITVLANSSSTILQENLFTLAESVKSINVVTNNLNKFKNIEENIRNKYGVLIRITNNKRKSIQNSKLILNFDFPEELVNQYKIYKKAIIINTTRKIKIYSKCFSGLNINDYTFKTYSEELKKLKKLLTKDFNEKELYESILIKEQSFYKLRKRLKQDKMRIISLIDNNKKIPKNEYFNFG